jgi:hypothetical protein
MKIKKIIEKQYLIWLIAYGTLAVAKRRYESVIQTRNAP